MAGFRDYLFKTHSEATLRGWANRLRFFRFVRAHGPPVDDGDELLTAWRYGNTAELRTFFEHVKFQLVISDPPPPKASSYRIGDPTYLGDTGIQQPGHCELGGQRVFIWCHDTDVRISRASGYEVTEADVTAAEAVEKLLKNAPLQRLEPPVDSEHCLCPKRYPDFFEGR